MNHSSPQTNDNTAEDAHTIGENTHYCIIGCVFLSCFQRAHALSHQVLDTGRLSVHTL